MNAQTMVRAQAEAADLQITVIIPTLGRAAMVAALLPLLAAQSAPPERVILSVTGPDDLPDTFPPGLTVDCLTGPKGSCAQRNRALDALDERCDIAVFLDDDFIPSRHFLARVRAFMAAHPDVAGVSGRMLADGATGPGVSLEEAKAIVATHDAAPAPPLTITHQRYGLYGCNMAFRRAALDGVRFDERLPLYGWQEDIDFAAQIRLKGGRLVSTHAFAGVHMGIKAARSPGVRIGYSQVVNPVYLAHKGTMRPRYALRIAARNVLANHARMFRPEPWVDRRGRVWGNWLALFDLMRGRITPERILRL